MRSSRVSKGKAKPVGSLVRTYLAAQPPETRRALRMLRETIRGSARDAVESFSYGIPGFKLDGKPLVWYAGFKEHTSLYPMGDAIRRAHAAALKGYKTSTGTIRFPLTRQPSSALVRKLVKARIGEVRGATKA